MQCAPLIPVLVPIRRPQRKQVAIGAGFFHRAVERRVANEPRPIGRQRLVCNGYRLNPVRIEKRRSRGTIGHAETNAIGPFAPFQPFLQPAISGKQIAALRPH